VYILRDLLAKIYTLYVLSTGELQKQIPRYARDDNFLARAARDDDFLARAARDDNSLARAARDDNFLARASGSADGALLLAIVLHWQTPTADPSLRS
jgi:hypothetical protein